MPTENISDIMSRNLMMTPLYVDSQGYLTTNPGKETKNTQVAFVTATSFQMENHNLYDWAGNSSYVSGLTTSTYEVAITVSGQMSYTYPNNKPVEVKQKIETEETEDIGDFGFLSLE